MVIQFLPYKIAKEIEFISNMCADKDFMSVTPDDVIHNYWAKIFALAGKFEGTEEEKNIIFDELSIAYDLNLMLLGMTRREIYDKTNR